MTEDNLAALEYKFASDGSYTSIKDTKVISTAGKHGVYEIKATNTAGKTTVKTVTVYDKPAFSVSVLNGGSFNDDNATKDDVEINVTKGSDTLLNVKKGEDKILTDSSNTSYTVTGEEGTSNEYTVSLKDKYGSKATDKTFTIDKVIPNTPVITITPEGSAKSVEVTITYPNNTALDSSNGKKYSINYGENDSDNVDNAASLSFPTLLIALAVTVAFLLIVNLSLTP